MEMMDEGRSWTTEVFDTTFERWFNRELNQYEQAVLVAAIERVLERYGIAICQGEWGKPLGGGLYEFRVRQSLHAIETFGQVGSPAGAGEDRPVLLRVFLTFHGDRMVLLFHGYNKKRDPSKRRQDREIDKARRLHKRWRRDRHHD